MHARAEIAFPFLHNEVRLVHELERQDLTGEVRSLAAPSVSAHERLDHLPEECVTADVRVEHVGAPVR